MHFALYHEPGGNIPCSVDMYNPVGLLCVDTFSFIISCTLFSEFFLLTGST